jgi:hypothetical protein
MFSKISKGKNKQKKNSIFFSNQYNNFQKCSITNNNILLKLNEDVLKKNYIFDSNSLSSTSADSFEIKSSYSNINEASKGAYIKEKNFQKDLLKYVKDYKNKKKILAKKKNTKASVDMLKVIKNPINYITVENSIKSVKKKMSNYLCRQIKLIKETNLGLKRKNSYSQKLKSKKIKKELSLSSIINSSSLFNSSQISLSNKNINNNIRTSYNSLNEIESPLPKSNTNSGRFKEDSLREIKKIKDKTDFDDIKSYKYSRGFKTEKNKEIYI